MKSNLQYLIATVLLFLIAGFTQELEGQYCVSGNCNPNTFVYSEDPNTIEYDNIIGVFHSSMVREANGVVKVWGQGVAQNGQGQTGNILTTTDPAGVLSGANFGSGSNQLTGDVLKFTGASSSNTQQFAVLTTNGLYLWGNTGVLVPTNIPNSSAGSFRKVNIGTYNVGGGTKADGLPSGVSPTDVKMMFGTRMGLAIVTCDGQAWVLTDNGNAYGDGASDTDANDLLWHRVSTAANTPLQNVVAVRGTYQVFMALTADGNIYTWGDGTRINSGAPQSRNFATMITKPSGVTPKMIGMTASSNGKTYYLLATDGRLFAMGENEYGQLGNGGTTDSNVWGQVTATTTVGGTTYTIGSNVQWISPMEHDRGTQIQNNAAISVVTNQGKVWSWGANSYGMLGFSTGTSYVSTPGLMPGRTSGAYDNQKLNISDVIMAVETGGHTTLLIKQCSKKFGYVGHRIRGSMADGTTVDAQEDEYNFGQTGDVTICGAPTSPGILPPPIEICRGTTIDLNDVVVGTAPTGFILEFWTTSTRSPGTQLTGTGITEAPAGTYYAFYIPSSGPCETPAFSEVIITETDCAISLVKTASAGPHTVGDVITYTFTVKNTGGLTLSNVTVSDPLLGLGMISPASVATLAPDEETIFTAPYTVTQADVDNGNIHNTATATGTPPGVPPVSDDDEEDVPLTQTAAINLVKTASSGSYGVGDVVTYTFTV
ncbi:MAG: DUF11 domain-containing protein, partial [Chitinophagales bacterium]|nr:DUF11 domain-containing protein [Chitinophagales bacterium]